MGVKGLLGRFFKSRVYKSRESGTPTHQKGYFDSVKETFEDIINVDTLHMDANFLLYILAAYAYGLGDFGTPDYIKRLKAMKPEDRDQRCFAFITAVFISIIRDINPLTEVTINFDGPVPMAKMCQQRQRRYRHSLELSNELFDTNAITPGTPWMMALDRYMKKQIPRMHEALQFTSNLNIIYSSSLVPGEGEHKIFDRLRKNETTMNNSEGKHVILGGDTDLILLSLISGVDNLYVMTDMYFKFQDGDTEITLKADTNRKPSVINSKKVRSGIKIELNNRVSAVHDFVFMISLVGNDFLPRLASMENMEDGIDSVMKAIKSLDTYEEPIIDITAGYSIVWSNVQKVIDMITVGDADKMIPSGIKRILEYNRSLDRTKAAWRPFQAAIAVTVDKNNLGELHDNFRGAWYYNSLCPKNNNIKFTVDYSDVFDMCIQYLRGLNWINLYYHYGSDAVTWKWQYSHYYSPMLSDISEVLLTLRNETGENMNRILYSGPRTGEVRISPLHQLVAVMPPLSLDSVPLPIHRLWDDESILSDLMVSSIIIDQDCLTPYSRNKYYSGTYQQRNDRKDSLESRAIFVPFADYDRLVDAVNSLRLAEPVLSQYAHQGDIIVALTKANPTIGVRPNQFTKLNPAGRGRKMPQVPRTNERKPYKKQWSHQQHDTSQASLNYFNRQTGF